VIKLKQFIPTDFCLKCKGCCRFSSIKTVWSPKLLEEEKKPFKNRPLKLRPYWKDGNFICSFLEPLGNRCQIYPERPFECQLYPFLINLENNKIFLAVDLNCSFIAKNFNNRKFQGYKRYLVKKFKTKKAKELLRGNYGFAQEYNGVLNISMI
jgi:Fe-S-cluster containining protein